MFLLLGWLLAQNLLAAERSDADARVREVPVSPVCSYTGQGQAFVRTAALPCLPEAELTGGAGQWQLASGWRVQRVGFADGGSSPKALLNAAGRRALHDAGCLEGRFDNTVFHSFHRLAEYYVFALRKILI